MYTCVITTWRLGLRALVVGLSCLKVDKAKAQSAGNTIGLPNIYLLGINLSGGSAIQPLNNKGRCISYSVTGCGWGDNRVGGRGREECWQYD